ncbi:variable large family protein [Borreliella lusitaniae]|uniref:variable large family protein n=1 Tax=Borreliella lusitaniae TaxID=100177 RepID=UPI003AB2C4D7
MKKISSVIFLLTFLVFINCKNNAGEASSSDETDQGNKFYQSVIKLGNGFLDVFTSFGGLVADALGLKADPKKSEVKTYFDTIAKKLEETVKNLEQLLKESGDTTDQVQAGEAAGGEAGKNSGGSAVEVAVKELNGLITEMAAAAAKGAEAATGDAAEAIGNVAAAADAQNAGGARGDAASVKGIAAGMKGIVGAAAKMGVELKAAAAAAAGAGNANVGNLFASGGAAANADAAAAGDAADAVSKVSGQQILKAIVESADGAGAAPANATNPIDAAIGAAAGQGANFAAGMLHNDKIAAAIVLRGMAKDGKFALAAGEAAAVNGVKSTVEGAVNKTLTALTDLVREAVQSGLKKVAEAVKAAGNAAP